MKWSVDWWRRWKSRIDRVVPTERQAVFWFAAGICWFLGAKWAPGTGVWLMILFAALAVAAYDAYNLLGSGIPAVKREECRQPQLGIEFDMRFIVANSARLRGLRLDASLPREFVLVRPPEVVEAGVPNGATVLSLSARPVRRGSVQLTDFDVLWMSRFGLWRRMHRYIQSQTLLVLPDLTSWQPAVAALTRAVAQEGRNVARLASGNSEFSHIADYSIDDDPRHLNWAASVRRGRLLKNVLRPERGQNVILAIDASRYMDVRLPDGKLRLDYVVESAAAMAGAALAQGDGVGLLAFTNQMLVQLPPAKGTAHWREVIVALAGLRAQPVQGGYQSLLRSLTGPLSRRSLLVLFSELEGVATDVGFLSVLSRVERRHPTIFMAIADVEASEKVSRIPETEHEALNVAAAQWVLDNRAKTVRTLRSQGLTVVESLPGRLAVDAVRAYLKRKRRFVL